MLIKIKPNVGFMFREQEIARIQDIWRQGQSVLLVGIRRTGKSALMKAALSRQQSQPGGAVYLDVQDYSKLYQLYQELLEAMPQTLQSRLYELLKNGQRVPDALLGWLGRHVGKVNFPVVGGGVELKTAEVQLERYWEPIAQALIELVNNHTGESLPVIGIDELPFMLEHLREAKVSASEVTIALASLRKLRDAGLRMIIGGSISMENQLTLLDISHTVLGGLKRQLVPPFTREEAEKYLSARLTNTPAAMQLGVVLDRLPDYVPQFLEEAVLDLKQLSSTDDVDDCIEEKVLPAIRKAFLRQFDERLVKNYAGDEARLAESILDMIAAANQSGGRVNNKQLPTGARNVLIKLQYDMFIEEAPDFGYRFTLNLLRQWWCGTRGIDALGHIA